MKGAKKKADVLGTSRFGKGHDNEFLEFLCCLPYILDRSFPPNWNCQQAKNLQEKAVLMAIGSGKRWPPRVNHFDNICLTPAKHQPKNCSPSCNFREGQTES